MRTSGWLGILAAALLGAGCSPAAGDSPYFGKTVPPEGQELRYISGSEPESLDPQVSTGQPESRIEMAIYDGLTEYDPQTAQPIPALATNWEANADNTEFTFHLRPGIVWSDGSPLTATDFVYAIQRGLAPGLASRAAYLAYDIQHAQAFNEGAVFVRDSASGEFLMDAEHPSERLLLPGRPEERTEALSVPALARARNKTYVAVRAEDVGVDAVDAATVRFRMRQPVPFLPKMVAHQFFRPVQRKAVEAWGDAWTRPEHIVTSGAFTLSEWRPYDRIVVVKNPRYWDAASVRLDRITFYAVDDLTTMMNLYKAGDVDATFNHTVPAAWIDHVRHYRDYMDAAECSTEYLLLNTKKPPMDDVRVRRAFNMAIDKSALAAFRRVAKPITTAVPPGIFPGYPSPPGAPFDPDAARKLLAEAGYRNAQGQFDPSRFPVDKVDLTYNTSESNRSTAEFVQAQWKQNLSLTIPLRNMEFKTFLATRGRLEYQGAARGGWIGDYLDPFTFLSLYSVDGGSNGTGWTDAGFMRMLSAANREPNPARRDELLAQAEAALLEQQPMIPLFSSATNWMRKPFVKGMYPNPVTMHAWKAVYIEHDPAKWD